MQRTLAQHKDVQARSADHHAPPRRANVLLSSSSADSVLKRSHPGLRCPGQRSASCASPRETSRKTNPVPLRGLDSSTSSRPFLLDVPSVKGRRGDTGREQSETHVGTISSAPGEASMSLRIMLVISAGVFPCMRRLVTLGSSMMFRSRISTDSSLMRGRAWRRLIPAQHQTASGEDGKFAFLARHESQRQNHIQPTVTGRFGRGRQSRPG